MEIKEVQFDDTDYDGIKEILDELSKDFEDGTIRGLAIIADTGDQVYVRINGNLYSILAAASRLQHQLNNMIDISTD